MSLQETVRGALGVISGLIPETVLTIISNGQTATGPGFKSDYGESMESLGERGVTRGRVIIDASDLVTPEKGSTILVNGEKAIVGNVALDATGANLTIDFQLAEDIE
jgi:hypothetical protein